MYYRIGDRVRIEKGRINSIWDGMTGTFAYVSRPDRYGFCKYGINLDEADANGKTKLILITNNVHIEHRRLTKLDSSELHPKFLDYKSFKFK